MIDAAGEGHMFRHELGSALTMELIDLALLRDAAAPEGHEIAAYEMLADAARTIERDDCAQTLGEILAAERRTLTLATALAARHPSR